MSTKRKKPCEQLVEPAESKSSEAITVAWMVTITTLFFCDATIVGAHILSKGDPAVQGFRLMKELLLIMGCGLGVLSLLLLVIVYRVRKLPPPTGVAMFGACLAAGPILALVVRSLSYKP